MKMEWNVYLEAFGMLFVVFDAIGNAPIFFILTKNYPIEIRRKIFVESVSIAGAMLLAFAMGGWSLLEYFGITVEDFRIAGGIMLLILAIQGLLGKEEAQIMRSEDIAVVPMATPLLAGPGSICTVIYLSTEIGLTPTIFAIIANTAIALLIFRYTEVLLRILGHNLLMVISRIMAFLLAALAISMIREGVLGILREIP